MIKKVFGASIALVLCVATVGLHAAGNRPNIIIITADDLGQDAVALYNAGTDVGPNAPVPGLEFLASQGMKFNNGWSQPACTTTRGAITMGKLPSTSGMAFPLGRFTPRFHSITGEEFPPTQINTADPDLLAKQLQAAGYRTAKIGKWHQTIGPGYEGDPNDSGYDHFFGQLTGAPSAVNGYQNWDATRNGVTSVDDRFMTKALMDETLQFVRDSKVENKPYFIWLSFAAPHWPYRVAPGPDENAGLDPVIHASVIEEVKAAYGGEYPEANTAATNPAQARAAFESLISYMDGQIARMFGTVKFNSTFVIFAGDNGTQGVGGPGANDVVEAPWSNTKAKNTMYLNGSLVPFLAAGPKMPRGVESDELVNVVDIYATVTEMAGLDKPASARDSLSFVPALYGGPSARRIQIGESFQPTAAVGGIVGNPGAPPVARGEGRVIWDGRWLLNAVPARAGASWLCKDGAVEPADCLRDGIYDKVVNLEFYDTLNDRFETSDLLADPSAMSDAERSAFVAMCNAMNRVSRNANYFLNGETCDAEALLAVE